MQSVLVITGPTGSGKSGLALALAERLNGTIINADSMQVYSLYPVLSAQPSREEQKLAPHALYSSVHPPALSTADSWAVSASETIREVFEEGRLPILTGGTGLYLEFLMHGRSTMPAVKPEAKAQAVAEFEALGGEAILEKLKKVDPAAAKLRPSDKARVCRAYEVYLSSGRGIGDWQKENFEAPDHAWDYKTIITLPDRDRLYANIDQRFLKMIEHGAVEEVKAALAKNVPADHPAHKAVGARELQKVIEGEWKMEKAIQRSQQLSRNYAKRQFTWFKNRFANKEKATGRPILTLEGANFAENLNTARNFTN
jgi:tRNA dimethylallyltransferase